jgi:cyclic pyranopterin phosphate synthase
MNKPLVHLPALPIANDRKLQEPLVDRFGRVHRSLRISVTDVCNIRCQYCMPADGVEFLPQQRLLSFSQIESFVQAAVACGIRNLRITGGEPLLRPELHQLIGKLRAIPGVEDIALTTNGMLLANQIERLVEAGLQRVNVSLDTLSETTFKQLSRRDGLQRVLDGIESTLRFPQLVVKFNALVLRDINVADVFDLVEFAMRRGSHMRFIEFMPLDSDRSWTVSRMVSGTELREMIAAKFGRLQKVADVDPSQPSVDYEFVEGAFHESRGRIGFIDSVSQPFCGGCDRLRLTADGKVRNCLFGREEWDVSELLQASPCDAGKLQAALRESVLAKHASHGMADPDFQPPQRAMYQIGG